MAALGADNAVAVHIDRAARASGPTGPAKRRRDIGDARTVRGAGGRAAAPAAAAGAASTDAAGTAAANAADTGRAAPTAVTP